jgi:hypothetical protein
MRVLGIAALLLWVAGCTTTRVVNLDTGQRITTYKPVDSAPVHISEREFKSAVERLVLDLRWEIALDAPAQGEHSLLASAGGLVDGARSRPVSPSARQNCQRRSNSSTCLSLLAGEFSLTPLERRTLALSFALDTVWDGVAEVVKDLADPEALRAMVTSIIGTSLVMLVAPEPITKLIAVALTASLIAYLGTGPVWNLGQGFLRLMEDAQGAHGFAELEDVGHRFGKVLGSNGARVLVLVALTTVGGKNAMAAQGPTLPGAARAAIRVQSEGGFQLSGALVGSVRSIALPSASVLNIALAPTAVAAVAMGPGGSIQGDPDGEVHHICTDKNEVSEASGGPWTPLFEPFFNRAKMKLGDVENQVRIKGHKGPHPREYHQEVLRRISEDMLGCRSPAACKAALVDTLTKIARELTTPGSKLRKLITRNPDA